MIESRDIALSGHRADGLEMCAQSVWRILGFDNVVKARYANP